MSIIPKLIKFIIRFTIPIKISGVNIDKLILKFINNSKISRIAKTNFKKNKVGKITLIDFKAY